MVLLLGVVCHAGERVRIGAEDDWRPYSYLVAGQPTGFAVDVVRAAWAAAGVEVELVSLPYARCMKEVDRGALAGCFDTLRDSMLEPRYRWHQQPLFRASIGIYGPAGAVATRFPLTVESLRSKRVGTTHGYDYGEVFDGDPGMLRDVAPSDISSLRKLVAGRVDYALVYDRVASEIARANPDLAKGYARVGLLADQSLYLSFARDFPGIERMIALFDQGLSKVRKSGEYARIEARWR